MRDMKKKKKEKLDLTVGEGVATGMETLKSLGNINMNRMKIGMKVSRPKRNSKQVMMINNRMTKIMILLKPIISQREEASKSILEGQISRSNSILLLMTKMIFQLYDLGFLIINFIIIV